MSYLVLARKWRPQNFEDITGQGHICRTLQNAIRSRRIAHAYLFTGVRGVGKTTAARVLAKALNCQSGPTPTPCNQCDQCEEITNGSSIDVLEIDGASNRGIDEVRQIIENVRYQPAKSRFKVYIIDEVHQVTKDAFNALLKTLEEPPPSAKFVLATTEPHRLPETILSRCQRFDFRRIALRDIVQRLKHIAEQEGLNISDGALILLAREADGSMRDAQSLLEQIVASTAPAGAANKTALVDETALLEILGLAERRIVYDISSAVIKGEAKTCIELVALLVAQGRDLCRVSRDLVEQFRNLLVARLTEARQGEVAHLLDLPDQEVVDLKAQAGELSVETLLDYFDFMSSGDEEINRATNARFALETVLVRLATLPKSLPVAALLARLEKLESHFSPRGTVTRPLAGQSQTVTPASGVGASSSMSKGNVGDESLWQNFVAFVGREKKLLASHLESGTPLEISRERLKIGVAERYHLNYLQDTENFLALKAMAKQFFADEVSIDIAGVAADETARAAGLAAGATSREGQGSSEMVKEALRIFGGSARVVRRERKQP